MTTPGRRIIAATIIALTFMAGTPSHVAADIDGVPPAQEAQAPYAVPAFEPEGGESVRFRVLRQGKPFGYHHIDFERDDAGGLMVRNDVHFKFAIGPVTLFNYRHKSTETWQDGQLVGLSGKTRKSGKDFKVDARAAGNEIIVDGTLNMGEVGLGILPFSHWHSGQVNDTEILSSESGELIPIKVEPVGREELQIGDRTVEATRFRMTSELVADLWYDDQGRWLKFAFKARGQNIEYRLDELY